MPRSQIYRFGEFELDAGSKRLARGGEAIPLSERQADALLQFVSRPGEILSKDALVQAVWRGVAVTDNSVEQVVSSLRKIIDSGADGARAIETVPRRGYRFAAAVASADVRMTDADLDALLDPYRALVGGRAALETLERDAVARAMRAFEAAAAAAPDRAAPHVGLANALVMQFESTRADAAPDAGVLARAGDHARDACRLDPEAGEAWATLALVLHHTGQSTEAVAAAGRAVSLEPDNWRHHLRLSYVAWGEERLRAAHRTLALFPGFALAHWLAATVYVARSALDLAARELEAGAAAQDPQHGSRAFASVGCHWLLGLIRLARGDAPRAMDEFRRELAHETAGQLHARECAANSLYAMGAVHLRAGRMSDAAAAFEQALVRVPAHVLAMIGARAAQRDVGRRSTLTAEIALRLDELARHGKTVDVARARAAEAIAAGDAEAAAGHLERALAHAPDGSAGWMVPLDPFLDVPAHENVFARVLGRLRAGAG